MLSLVEVGQVVRNLLEAFILVISIQLLAGKSIEYRKTALIGIIYFGIAYIVRMLPIHFGVHTLLLAVILTMMLYKVYSISVVKAATSSVFAIILMYFSELLCIIFYTHVLDVQKDEMLAGTMEGVLYSTPPLVVMFILVNIIIWIKNSLKKGREVKNEEIS